jgi:carbon monoxide dehydrogenase subunit G
MNLVEIQSMASIQKSVDIKADAQSVWEAVSDAGQLHVRVAPGLVTDTQLEEDGAVRIVTFANGISLKEYIISNDDDLRRLVWSAESDQWNHHNASLQVIATGEGACQVTWTADVLPHSAGTMISTFVDMGLAAMKAHIDS